jgi:DNA topoisomerase VI subunit A
MRRYALPQLMWLGVLKAWVDAHCDPENMQDLTAADLGKLYKLIRQDERIPSSWKTELREMEDAGVKCEIETVYKVIGVQAFCKLLVEHMAMYIAL